MLGLFLYVLLTEFVVICEFLFRCHLFGIGGEACSVLLSSLAAVTKGTSLKVTDPVLLPKLVSNVQIL
jgi:hypothetical protein